MPDGQLGGLWLRWPHGACGACGVLFWFRVGLIAVRVFCRPMGSVEPMELWCPWARRVVGPWGPMVSAAFVGLSGLPDLLVSQGQWRPWKSWGSCGQWVLGGHVAHSGSRASIVSTNSSESSSGSFRRKSSTDIAPFGDFARRHKPARKIGARSSLRRPVALSSPALLPFRRFSRY